MPIADGEVIDTCVACEEPLTEAEIAWSYNDGPVCCAACAPTPEEQEAGRRECRDAWGEIDGTKCWSDTCRFVARCWPEDKQ